MIGKLKGIIDSISNTALIIDVGGVGYVAYASAQTLGSLVEGQPASLFIETHVREDHIHLFGFANEEEQEWFRILTTVKGVGNRMAMAVLSVLKPDQLVTALMAQDKAAFTQISGVGPKLAERILIELKDKVPSVGAIPVGTIHTEPAVTGNNALNDAVSALTNLGYNRSDAYRAASKTSQDNPDSNVEDLIRNCLKELVA